MSVIHRILDNWQGRALAGGAALVIIGLLGLWLFGGSARTGYVTQRAAPGDVSRAVTATGSVNPVLTITVGTYVSGVIQAIYCDFNTKVHKGQLCAKIDPRPYKSIVDQDRANLATGKAQLEKDQANLAYATASRKRISALFASSAASRDQLDSAVSTEAQAKAQVALDRGTLQERDASLSAAEINLGYTDITSPVDGTVVSRNVTMGQTVAASFQTPTMFLIATDLSKMQVDTNVSESDIGRVHGGEIARFTVEAFPNRTFEGTIDQVRQAPQTVQNVVTYDVVITAPNPDFALKPGMTATVRIITDERRNVLRVPDQALRYTPGGLTQASGNKASSPQVWVLRRGKPVAVSVKTGLDDDSFTEITGGDLKAGDRVIVSERAGAGASQSRGGSRQRPLRF